jgi:hypothetical protein
VHGFTGACGTTPIEDANQQTDSHVVDTAMPDLVCGYTCYTPSATVSPVGTAPCRDVPNGCQTNNAWLNPIALCSCSAGEPELYVQRVGTMINVALVGPQLAATHSYAMTINNGQCYGTGQVCPAAAVASCAVSSEVDGWIQIPMPSGPLTTFRFFDDDGGTGCTGAVKLTFVVAL